MDWNATTFGQKAESVPPALSRSAADEIDVSLHLFIYGFCPNSIIYLASWSSNLPTVPAKSGGTMGAMRNLWIRWKMLRLPWRKTFLIGKEAPPPLQRGICISQSPLGQDLQGNTFWEFKDTMNTNRVRRMVRSSRRTHFSDVKISPQWHQWLRQTRYDPPTIQEQQADIGRQAQLKYLAQQADERWASKPSFLDQPRDQPKPATLPKVPGAYAPQTDPDKKKGVGSTMDNPVAVPEPPKTEERPNPWKRASSGGPSEQWQPESWTPGSAKKR